MKMKTFEIDFDSIEECMNLIPILKSRIGHLNSERNPDFVSKNEMVKRKFAACCKIIDSDISLLYADLQLSESKDYYVYAHCDPSFKIALKKDGISTFAATMGMDTMPFYIGKGIGNRAYELDRNDSHRKVRQRLKTFDQDIRVSILKSSLTEKEALMLESKLIDIFGLKSFGGRLVNLDEGVKNKDRKQMYSEELKILNLFYRNSIKT